METEIREIHVVSHTHWDREWYLTREQYRLRLVGLVDRVLDLLEVAFALAALGVYGLIAFTVGERTRDRVVRIPPTESLRDT